MPFPSPDTENPVTLPDGSALPNNIFLSAVIDHPRMAIGDYSYLNAFDPPDTAEGWATRLAPYLFPFSKDRLEIGKFCQFADGVTFITNGANHRKDGFSTFPFSIHDSDRFLDYPASLPKGDDTVVGNDVWLGKGVTVLPGTKIGNGVIAGAGAVLSGCYPDYAVVAGNRAEVRKMRFDDATIAALLEIAWWDWPIAHILAHEAQICGGDLGAMQAAAL